MHRMCDLEDDAPALATKSGRAVQVSSCIQVQVGCGEFRPMEATREKPIQNSFPLQLPFVPGDSLEDRAGTLGKVIIVEPACCRRGVKVSGCIED